MVRKNERSREKKGERKATIKTLKGDGKRKGSQRRKGRGAQHKKFRNIEKKTEKKREIREKGISLKS